MAPRIQEYNPTAEVAGPFQTRQARDLDTGNAGGALSRIGASIEDIGGEMHKHDAQSEISNLTVQMSAAHANLTNDLQTALTAPEAGNNKDLATDYMQKYDDTMSDIGNTASTPEAQKYFQEQNAQTRAHMFVSAVQGQSKVAGAQAVSDYSTAKDNWASTLVSSPDQFQTLKGQHSALLQTMVDSNRLNQNQADELRSQGETDLAKAAVRGQAQIDPQGTLKQLNAKDSPWNQYFTGDQKYEMIRGAETAVNQQEIQQDKAQRAQQRIQEQQTQAWQNQRAADIRNGDTSDEAQARAANPPPNTKWQDIEAMQKYQKYNQDVKFDTNKGAMSALYERIHNPSDPSQKITSPGQIYSLAAGLVSPRDTDYLVKELSSKDNPDNKNEMQLKDSFVKMALGQLNPIPLTPGQRTPDQQGFLGAFLPAYEKAKAAGKDPVNLLTPGNPDYMGNLIHSMAQTPSQAIHQMVNNPTNVPASPLAPGSATTQSPGASGSQGQGQYGATVIQNGHTFNWNSKTGKYE